MCYMVSNANIQSGSENPSVILFLLYSKTTTVGPYSGGSIIVTLASAVFIAQICVPFTQIQKLVRLKHSSHDLCAVYTQQGLSCLTFPIAGHDTTGFVNHTPTILYLGTNL